MSVDACRATLRLLDAPGIPADLLATIRHDLERLPPFRVTTPDRVGTADAIVHMSTMDRSARPAWIEERSDAARDPLDATSIDANVILEHMHAFHAASDRVWHLPTWADRERAFSALEVGDPTMSRFHTLRRLLNRGVRSEHIGRNLVARRLRELRSIDAALTRNEALFALTRVAAALAAWRGAAGDGAATTYPERLDDLVPRFLDRLPTDPFSAGPFVYERRGTGYLLYSIGPNGRDDGGTALDSPIVAGEWVHDSSHTHDLETTDVVVRLPAPGSPFLEWLRAKAH